MERFGTLFLSILKKKTTKFFIFNIQKTAYFYDSQLVVKIKALKTTKNYKS